MNSINDQAIILRKTPFGEADIMLTLLTERHGKVRVLAKGARKSSSRLVGHTEPFSLISGQINFQLSIPIVSQVTVEHTIEGLEEDHRTLQALSFLAEIIDTSLAEAVPHEAIYALFWEGSLRLRQVYQPLLYIGLLLRLLGLLGYAPELQTCVMCKNSLSSEDRFAWSDTAGGVIAGACLSRVAHSEALDPEMIKTLRYLQRQPLKEMSRLAVPSEIADALSKLMLNYARCVLEQPLVSSVVSYDTVER